MIKSGASPGSAPRIRAIDFFYHLPTIGRVPQREQVLAQFAEQAFPGLGPHRPVLFAAPEIEVQGIEPQAIGPSFFPAHVALVEDMGLIERHLGSQGEIALPSQPRIEVERALIRGKAVVRKDDDIRVCPQHCDGLAQQIVHGDVLIGNGLLVRGEFRLVARVIGSPGAPEHVADLIETVDVKKEHAGRKASKLVAQLAAAFSRGQEASWAQEFPVVKNTRFEGFGIVGHPLGIVRAKSLVQFFGSLWRGGNGHGRIAGVDIDRRQVELQRGGCGPQVKAGNALQAFQTVWLAPVVYSNPRAPLAGLDDQALLAEDNFGAPVLPI